ncbi:hypothetical protein CHLRE_16g654050v5 [Chlamydomonas reinhardtii]|uniref:Uncharacterized protein n=1 Tax=Chlamydomonas reinhardtii TaxID=3055 RepID=A0A2K3CT44_CHLRE|nr:uncharacterized protein CHLRE_16g654050v5 [Chlamydomonas reinhardtii]PNW71431.1 hypothetical protein CHLRE_16g654050v5 [Chlamydomonas reinhardtii]
MDGLNLDENANDGWCFTGPTGSVTASSGTPSIIKCLSPDDPGYPGGAGYLSSKPHVHATNTSEVTEPYFYSPGTAGGPPDPPSPPQEPPRVPYIVAPTPKASAPTASPYHTRLAKSKEALAKGQEGSGLTIMRITLDNNAMLVDRCLAGNEQFNNIRAAWNSNSNWPSAEDVLMASNENKCKLWSFEKVVTDEDLRLAHNVQVSELAGQKVGGDKYLFINKSTKQPVVVYRPRGDFAQIKTALLDNSTFHKDHGIIILEQGFRIPPEAYNTIGALAADTEKHKLIYSYNNLGEYASASAAAMRLKPSNTVLRLCQVPSVLRALPLGTTLPLPKHVCDGTEVLDCDLCSGDKKPSEIGAMFFMVGNSQLVSTPAGYWCKESLLCPDLDVRFLCWKCFGQISKHVGSEVPQGLLVKLSGLALVQVMK